METNVFGAKPSVMSGTVILAAAAMAFLAIGCGEQKSKTAVQRADAGGVTAGVLATSGEKAPTVIASTEATTPEGGGTNAEVTNAESTATSSAETVAGVTPTEALPPDVAASVSEAIATAGGIVEILAEGSPDVNSVTLTDAVGKKYPFTYQVATDRWRVLYRIPIRTHTEQLGLSVTAENGANRWKRIWVFVDIGQAAASAAQADSGR